MPKGKDFFNLFDKQAALAVEAAHFFIELCQSGKFDDTGIQKMRDIEHEGDILTHEIIDTLNRTFITPFDREDIHALTSELDDVVDLIHSITTRMRLYRLSTADTDLMLFADVIEQSARALAKAINGLNEIDRPRPILDYCIEVNRLENVGDQLRENAIGKLFENSTDPVSIIKWKEIYEVAEIVLDKCEDVANIVESIIVKQG
jgi:predicted phosphate transport protein (TIGR00153 family)